MLWLATRQLAGGALAEIGKLDRERAARLGSQVARQLVAMQEAAIAPDSVTADDLVVEGEGDQERAWLLPNPHRSTGEDVSIATQSLVDLLEERVGQSMLDDPSFEPAALAEQLARLIRERPNKRRLLLAGIAAVALLAALAAILAVVLTDDAASPGSYSPPARITARIPLGAPATALAASGDAVWAATPSGALIKVDVKSESVVGAPLKLFPTRRTSILP